MSNKKKKSQNTVWMGLAIVTIVILLWVNHNSKKVELLYARQYSESYETQALVIRNEEVAHLDQQIDFEVKEGQRVGLNQTLSNSSSISFSDYFNREIDIINWLIDNKAYQKENLFSNDIEKIDKEIEKLNSDIKWAENFGNEKKLKVLNSEKDQLTKKKSYILKSFQYLGADEESLLELKKEYSSQNDTTGSKITAKKLNISFPGYIYFQSDGYESLLNANILQYLTPEYIRELENYNGNDDSNYKQTVKIIDDTYMYLSIILPKEVFLRQEEQVLKVKEQIMESIKTKDLNTYYHHLNNQFGDLRAMPMISFHYNEDNYKGHAIDIVEYGQEKLLLIQLKEQLPPDFYTQRQVDIDLVTYSDSGYIIPKKSIVQKDGKDNIIIMSKGSLKEYIEVKINRKKGKDVFLDKTDNKDIKEGATLIINP